MGGSMLIFDEAKMYERLEMCKGNSTLEIVREFLQFRRHKYRDRLELEENGECRGKAQECKELLTLFS